MVITKDFDSFDPGSSPGRTFPIFVGTQTNRKEQMGRFQSPRVHSSAVEHGIADPGVAGSIPAAPLSFCFSCLAKFETEVCF